MWSDSIPDDIIDTFELYNYNHAVEILTQAFPEELNELFSSLRAFSMSIEDIQAAGGNESIIPKKFSAVLEPLGWEEIRITGDLVVRMYPRSESRRSRFQGTPRTIKTLENFIDGHNVDYVKNQVACDLEWNSKDQTFDRDLFALRTYYECGLISAAVIITRSETLNKTFKSLGIMAKYGASTTWMGKLLPRLDARRHGGCPILAVGITPKSISNWSCNDDSAK